MDTYEFVLAIIAIVMGAGIVRHGIKVRYAATENQGDLQEELNELGVGDQLRKIDQLEERIRVLERLATDGGAKLARDIDQL